MALVLSAVLGHLQDRAYVKFGNAWQGELLPSITILRCSCVLSNSQLLLSFSLSVSAVSGDVSSSHCVALFVTAENMFYSHALALPGFLFVAPSIAEHARMWLSEPGVSLGNPLGIASGIHCLNQSSLNFH